MSKRDELQRAGRFRGCCGRPESRGADRGRPGRSSDTCGSSIDRAAEGRTAPDARSRGDEPPAHRRHAQSSGGSDACRRQRFIVGSFALFQIEGLLPATCDDAAAAVRSMERQVLEATERGSIEGVVLRYGMFYGLETPSTAAMIDMVRKRRLPVVRGDAGQLPLIHIEDAVSATVRALEFAPAGGVYDIVDDRAVSMTEIVEAIAEYTGSAPPLQGARLAAAAGRPLHGAHDLDSDAAIEHKGEGGAWLAAEVFDDARWSFTDVSTRGLNDGPGRVHHRLAVAVLNRVQDVRFTRCLTDLAVRNRAVVGAVIVCLAGCGFESSTPQLPPGPFEPRTPTQSTAARPRHQPSDRTEAARAARGSPCVLECRSADDV